MSEGNDPKPAPAAPHSPNRPVLLAALLGGLLGGVASFALARTFPAPAKPPPTPPPSEARMFADDVMALLKTGKYDQFKQRVRLAFALMPEADFENFYREGVIGTRQKAAEAYGPAGEFEFARETVMSPSLVRITYIERYERGCVLWSVVVYNSPGGWQVSAFRFETSGTGFPTLQ
jgi:hypothetical protein